MPFRSKKQLRTCYSGGMKGVDCDRWLDETPSVCCLPDEVGGKTKCRQQRVGERIVGKVHVGPRGGRFFTITEGSGKNKCMVKVYVRGGSGRSSPKPRAKGCGCGR